MQRRDFLKLAGYFSLSITMPTVLIACSSSQANRSAQGKMAFLHGVASADPRESSIVLWTRVTPLEDNSGYVDVILQIAGDESFLSTLLSVEVRIDESSDYTLRMSVGDLTADTIYYFRFITKDDVVSPTGRTWTAPAIEQNVALNFASVNCQHREHGFYSTYKLLLEEDIVKAREQQIRFILHLGDFIYETRRDQLQRPVDASGQRVDVLYDAAGNERQIETFPDGAFEGDIEYANTLADYRHLYKTYLFDENLQAARARWPFICVWDDHEFTDDCWQSEANYRDAAYLSTIDEPSQTRKMASNQAWYEYIPADYNIASGESTEAHHAHEFKYSSVANTPNTKFDSDGLAINADNIAAINSLTIYRSFRFGKLLQLVLTDCRSYRSDHPVPENISGNFSGFFHSRVALPLELVNILDAGSQANNSHPPVTLDLPAPLLNPRRFSPPGTMLGAKQKQWWKAIFSQSEAQWKIWSNAVPLMRLAVDLSSLENGLSDIVMSSDAWDGYNTERRELVRFLFENNITNVVSISGDLHAHYAGSVSDEHDTDEVIAKNFIPEFVCGSVSSLNQFVGLDQLSFRENPDETEALLRSLIVYTDSTTGDAVCNLNNTMLRGVDAALQAAIQADATIPVAETVAPLNPHLKYADTNIHGYGIFSLESDKMTAELVSVDSISVDPVLQSPQELRRVRFEVPVQTEVGTVDLNGPVITGEPPYPLS